MTLAEQLAQLPATALVPVGWVRDLLATENGAAESPRSDDRPPVRPGIAPAPSTDRLLTAREVAERLGCSARYVYAHAPTWPFTVRAGRMVRFSAAGLDRWLARRP